ncbi:MAG: glycine cleavage system protein H [Veillonellales bacterium]
MSKYVIPQELYYTEDHAWIKLEGNTVRIGISDFMQQLAGEITFIRVPRVGKTLAAGATLSSIQSGKWAGKLKVPMNGKVLETNSALTTNPKLLNDDCYGQGWICVMEPEDLAGSLGTLLHGETAEKFFAEEEAKHAKPE